MRPRRNVGIMGGTFDPIHIGHLVLGESAYQQFDLSEVLFMPSGNPWQKANRTGCASNEERTQMVRLAIAGNDHFTLSLAEMHEEGYTYTRHTLEKLTAQHPDTHYYFIMGADSLFSFSTWKDPERICQLCTLVVAVRDHLSTDKLREKIAEVKQAYQADVRLLTTLNMDISSHMLRDWVKEGRSIRYYTPDPVVDYIARHGIYQHERD